MSSEEKVIFKDKVIYNHECLSKLEIILPEKKTAYTKIEEKPEDKNKVKKKESEEIISSNTGISETRKSFNEESINMMNQEKFVKAPLHSKKSLLRSLEKIKKPKPYFKAEIGIDDYILYHKYDYVENKYDRPNSDIGSNMNIAKINESRVNSVNKTLNKSSDKRLHSIDFSRISRDYSESKNKKMFFNFSSGNNTNENKNNSYNPSTKIHSNLKSSTILYTNLSNSLYTDKTNFQPTINIIESEFFHKSDSNIFKNTKKDSYNYEFNNDLDYTNDLNTDLLEENDLGNEKQNYKNSPLKNHDNNNFINILNRLNNVDLFISKISDIPYEEEFIDGDEIKKILYKIFMNSAKYINSYHEYYMPNQNILKMFKDVKIIGGKIIDLNTFNLLIQSIIKNEKLKNYISFENFLNLIAKISSKLFSNCFLQSPEKCIYFLIKMHFEPILCKEKKQNLSMISHKDFIYEKNKKIDATQTSKKPYVNKNNTSSTIRSSHIGKQTNTNSRSLPSRIEKNDFINKYKNIVLNSKDRNAFIKPNQQNSKFESLHNNLYNQVNLERNNTDQVNSININEGIKNLLTNTNNLSYSDLENLLSIIVIDLKTKILINSITPTLLIIYKAYFENEIKKDYMVINNSNTPKKSYDMLMTFCKEFLVIPDYLSFNFVSNYYNLLTKSKSNALKNIFLSEEFSAKNFFKIKEYHNSKEVNIGNNFTFYKFCLFLFHCAVFIFQKLEKNIKLKKNNKAPDSISVTTFIKIDEVRDKYENRNDDNELSYCPVSQQMLRFLDYLENSKGLEKAEKRLVKIKNAELSFIPPPEILMIINKETEKDINENQDFNLIKSNNFQAIKEKTDGENDENINKTYNETHYSRLNNNIKYLNTKYPKGKIVGSSNKELELKLKDILSPAITYKTISKLEENLPLLEEMFTFYSISHEKTNIDKMNYSCFLKFLRESNLINSRNNNNNNTSSINKKNREEIFNSRIFGQCYVPKKIESISNFKRYDTLNKSLNVSNNDENNIFSNSNIVEINNYTINNIEKEKLKRPFFAKNFEIDNEINSNNNNSIDFCELNGSNNEFNKPSIVPTSNVSYNDNKKEEIIRNRSVRNDSMSNDKTKVENSIFTQSFHTKKYNYYKLHESEVSIIYMNLVSKKTFDFKKNYKNFENDDTFNNSNTNKCLKNDFTAYEENIHLENSNLHINSSNAHFKLNFNLFLKALEMIITKIYFNNNNSKANYDLKKLETTFNHQNSNDNSSISNEIDLCFYNFIDNKLPILYKNFKTKYQEYQKRKGREFSIDEYLDILKDGKIGSLVRDMQNFINIFFFNYCDKLGLISLDKVIEFLKTFDIYPQTVNLLFIKYVFGYYSQLFDLLVTNCKNGEYNYEEIERQGKFNDVKILIETENPLISNDKFYLENVKAIISKKNNINLIFFNLILAILSLKIKSYCKISNFEKIFYIYDKISKREDSIKKIFVKIGYTFNSNFDYKFYLKTLKEKYSDCFELDLNSIEKNQIKEEAIIFDNFFKK